MIRRDRETAINPRVAQRETRFVDSEVINKYDRIVFAGAQSERFQILYHVRGGLKPQGSYATLDEAIQARDATGVYAPQGSYDTQYEMQ